MNRAAERSGMNQRSEFPVREDSPKREKQEEKGRSAQEQRTELPVGENSPQREKHEEKGRSAQKAAELMKVSDFSVKAADQVKKQGVPQLVDALAAGRVSVSAAARIARLPPEQQQAVVAGIDNGLKANQALAQVQETFAKDQAGWVDDDGRPLPEGIIPAFRQRAELWNLCRRIEAFSRNVERLGNTPVSGHLDVQQVLTALEAVRHTLWAAQPARVCPQHPGEGTHCDLCRGFGWLPAGMRENTAA